MEKRIRERDRREKNGEKGNGGVKGRDGKREEAKKAGRGLREWKENARE